jgi:hypothetical protein
MMKCHALVSRKVLSFVVTLGAGLAACQPDPGIDSEAELASVEEAIHGTIGWAKTKDFERLYGIIAHDPTYLEVHPEDAVVRGFEEFRRMEEFWASPDFRAIRYEIRDLQILLSRSGDVAWFYCVLDDVNEWQGEPVSWMNARWTGVLEKRDGAWRMVQMHFSNAVNG